MHIVVLVVAAFIAGFLFNRYLVSRAQRSNVTSEPLLSEFEAHVSARDFDSMVLQASHQSPVVADFFASWCGPCHELGPRLAGFARDYGGRFLLAKIDVDAEKGLATRYQIQSMPTVLLFKDGKIVDRFVGAVGDHTIRYFLAKNGVQEPTSDASI